MPTTKIHMCLSIRGAIRNKMFSGFTDKNGRKLSRNEAENFLFDQLAEGKKVLPIGDCDNFDYQTGCLGHPMDEEEDQP